MLKSKKSARMLTVAGAVALTLGVTSGTQAATDTSDVAVTATVVANCSISTTSAVAFGDYDPFGTQAASPIDQTGVLAVTCTNGANATVTLSEGDNAPGTSSAADPDRRMTDDGTNFLNYSLFSNAGRTVEWDDATGVAYTGTGTAGSLTVYARLPAGQNVPVGSYTDLVVATITF